MMMHSLTISGVGVGLRACHYSYIEAYKPQIPWFEVLSDNYLCDGGSSLFHLEKIRADYPMTLHGVGMSLGSTDPLNYHYLKKLKKLIKYINPLLVSDHLCWTSFNDQYFHELLPLPYTEEAVKHTARRILAVQEFLGQKIMIENVSTYLSYTHSTMQEWEFIQAVADEADCLILLDINNIYVSGKNNQFNPFHYLQRISSKRVAQFHLAGYQEFDTHLLDTHGAAVFPNVWKLFEAAIYHFGPIPTVIERDNHIPNFPSLLKEVHYAQQIMEKYAVTA